MRGTVPLNSIISGKPGGMIRITDDGNGMDADDITERWWVLGRSKKVQNKPTKIGRIPTGDKGLGALGRFTNGFGCYLNNHSR
ncbi:hypothetical protein BGS_0819 [Beggiatoa sp. SS]|nr:hypothetical protein BGS_0819 [Beggiatoa sp. SS]